MNSWLWGRQVGSRLNCYIWQARLRYKSITSGFRTCILNRVALTRGSTPKTRLNVEHCRVHRLRLDIERPPVCMICIVSLRSLHNRAIFGISGYERLRLLCMSSVQLLHWSTKKKNFRRYSKACFLGFSRSLIKNMALVWQIDSTLEDMQNLAARLTKIHDFAPTYLIRNEVLLFDL